MATVYRARDTTNDAVVALKVLRAYFTSDPEVLQRFLQEMAGVQRLRHPNIVPVQSVERDGQTTAIVMDYVHWPNLKARKSRVLTLWEALAILQQVAAALDYAHGQGIVHRDLRPSNVFYSQDPGQVMISDFGTASLVEGGHPLLRSTVNTPSVSYASPEQIQGEPASPGDDVYALGALAYELLTGDVPFDALSPHTVLSRQLSTTPTAPSRLVETLLPAVDDVVLRALRRRKEERYASCAEMMESLRQAAGPQKPTTTGPQVLQQPPAEIDGAGTPENQQVEDARAFCPSCGSGNPASAARCYTCWGTLVGLPLVTPEEERRLVVRYLGKLRRRKRIVRGVVGGSLAALLAFWTYNLIEIRPPLPAPSSNVSSQSADGEWSMLRRDVLHAGVVPGPAFVPKGTVRWQVETEGPVFANPVVAGDRVYFATGDRRVLALDSATGDVLWTHSVTGPVNSAPAVAGDLVYLGLRDWRFLALDANTGELRWSYASGNPIYASATVHEGSLYFGSSDRRLYSFDARTGEVRWTRDAEGWVMQPPAISQGIVVFTSKSGELFMVDASNGTLRNQVKVALREMNLITLVDDVAYLTSRLGHVLAFRYTQRDIPFQKAVWKFWLQSYVWGMAPQPTLAPGLVWKVELNEGIVADLAAAHGRLFVATFSGRLRAMDQKTGETLWMVEGLAPLYSSPIVSGDTVIQTAFDGTIHGIDLATGEERWNISVDGKITVSAILADGTLYVATRAGTLYAIE